HEPRRTVHVPHPGVTHRDLEVCVAAVTAHLHVHMVGQVETSIGLDDIGEQMHDVAVLPVQRQLHLGLVLLEVFRTHVVSLNSSSGDAGSSATSPPTSRATLAYERRCCAHGPCRSRARPCSVVT